MSTTDLGYYNTVNTIKIDENGNPYTVGPLGAAALSGLGAFLFGEIFKDLPDPGSFKTLVFKGLYGNAWATAAVKTIEVVVNSDGEISFDGGDIFDIYSQAAIATAFIIGLGITGTSILGGVIISSLVSVAYSGFKYVSTETIDYVVNQIINPTAVVDLKYYDSNGAHTSGVVYLQDTSSSLSSVVQRTNAISHLVSKTAGNLNGSMEFDDLGNGVTTNYFADITEAWFLDDVVLYSDAENFEGFLNTSGENGTKNIDFYAENASGVPHYFTLTDIISQPNSAVTTINHSFLHIPVVINGTQRVITVNKVYVDSDTVFGKSTPLVNKNLIIPDSNGNLSSTNIDDLILHAGSIDGSNGDDTIIGTAGNDSLRGGNDDDVIDGGIGKDILYGDDGNDTLYGNIGNDTLIGGEGDNQLNGGEGIDTADYTFTNNNATINLGAGTANIKNLITDVDDVLNSVENLILGNGWNNIEGSSEDNSIVSGDKDDTLRGQAGEDTLYGNDGNDEIFGDAGDDTLYGEKGADTLYGGLGGDSLDGGENKDTLYGEEGEDFLSGGAHNDNLDGGGDNDTLSGGSGHDILSGQAGDDTYIFSLSGDDNDTISDHNVGDRIKIGEFELAGQAVSVGSNTYELSLAQLTWASNGLDLVIKYGPNGTDSITLKDFVSGEFGITLGSSTLPPPPPPPGDEEDEEDGFSPPINVPVAPPPRDPLVVDLEANGIGYINILDTNNTVAFDLDGNGDTDNVGWISGDDGFLAIDANNNGIIDNIDELIGGRGERGFDVLATFDDNSDGLITSADSIYSDLLIWQDADEDGETDVGELTTVASRNFEIINLVHNDVDLDAEGNNITGQGSLLENVSSVLESRSIDEVDLNIDAFNIQRNDLQALQAIYPLPYINGFGSIDNIYVAMWNDPTLLTMMEDFVALDLGEALTARDSIADIMYEWAGVDNIDPASRGWHIDGRKIHFLEELTGGVLNSLGSPIINAEFGALLEGIFQEYIDYYHEIFLLQAQLGNFFPGATTPIYDNVIDYGDDLPAIVERFADSNESTLIKTQVLDFLLSHSLEFEDQTAFDQAVADIAVGILEEAKESSLDNSISVDFLDSFIETAQEMVAKIGGTDVNAGVLSALNELLTELEAATSLNDFEWSQVANDLANILYVTNSNATELARIKTLLADKLSFVADELLLSNSVIKINGTPLNDLIFGGTGPNHLDGNDGDDTLIGGEGDDLLEGGSGTNTVLYNLEDGDDALIGIQIIKLAEGITLDDISLTESGTSGQDLLISIADGGSLTVYNHFSSLVLQSIELADGTSVLVPQTGTFSGTTGDDYIVDIDNRADLLSGLEGNDTLRGKDLDDTLEGGADNDHLQGESGDDVLEGGTGDDALLGGIGDDIYIYNVGDGDDTINEVNADGLDTIQFGAGITSADVTLTRVGFNDLQISIAGSGTIVVTGQFQESTIHVEQLKFDDNSIVALPDILDVTGTAADDLLTGSASNADNILGLEGDDTLYGLNLNDSLEGGLGDDLLQGGIGNDSYIYNLGDGNDTIDETTNSDGIDAIIFGAGITQANVTLARSANNNLEITISDGSVITVKYQFYDAIKLEELHFADNSVLILPTELPVIGTANDDHLSGSTSDDSLEGLAGNDTLLGDLGDDTYIYNLGDGNDLIWDNLNENNIIQFGAGIAPSDVTIANVNGDLILTLTDGSTLTVTGQFIYDSLVVGELHFADGTIVVPQQAVNISATSGDDLLFGMNLADTISGLEGNDTIHGNGDADTLSGNDGADSILGGAGDDFIEGNADSDKVFGDAGADTVYGNDGDDFVSGGDDNDVVYGGAGSDWVQGQSGAFFNTGTNSVDISGVTGVAQDTLYGGAGNDLLIGSYGNDRLEGGADNDTYIGLGGVDTYVYNIGDGDDLIFDASLEESILEFGVGITAADISFSRVSISGYVSNTLRIDVEGSGYIAMHNQFLNPAAGITTINFADGSSLAPPINIAIYGTSLVDRLEGGDDDNTLYGFEDDDSLFGNLGADSILGGAGNDWIDAGNASEYDNDTIIGGTGNDTLDGGGGDDTYIYNLGDGNDILKDSFGNDVMLLGAGIVAADVLLSRVNDDLIIQFPDGGSITVPDQFSNSELILTTLTFDDNSTLDLPASIDIVGTANTDVLIGGDQDDTLIGGAGDDDLRGGYGNDTYVYNLGDGNDTITETNSIMADNTIVFGAGIAPEDIILTRALNNDLLIDVQGSGSITVINQFWNFYGDNIIIEKMYFDNGTIVDLPTTLDVNGTGNDDTIFGGNSDEQLFGNDGNDQIFAAYGDDTLIGGTGDDTLDGGGGNDIYIYNLGDDNDTINEFYSSDTNIIQFGEGITSSKISYFREGNDLQVDVEDSGRITLTNHFPYARVQEIHFSNGIVHSLPDENVATLGHDYLVGDSVSNTIEALAGNDTLVGNTGNDLLDGGTGDDTYVYNLGDGNDIILEESAENNVIAFGSGITSSDITQTRESNDLILTIAGQDEILIRNQFKDTDLRVTLLTYEDGSLTVLPSTMPIVGTTGSDILIGSPTRDDVIDGLDGDDLFIVYHGNDSLTGGAGDDRFVLAHTAGQTDTISDFNASDDLIDISSAAIGSYSNLVITDVTGGVEIDANGHKILLEGSYAAADVQQSWFVLSGGVVIGEDIAETINGGGQSDTLYGGDGDDTLSGNSGADTLIGGKGNDTLIGGRQDDVLYGGEGNDTYIFETVDGEDTLSDSSGIDRIRLFSEQLLLIGNATASTVSGWEYELQYGNGDISYFNWAGDPLVAGSRGDLIVDFDATLYYDIVIENFASGEFGITLEGALQEEDPEEAAGEDPLSHIFSVPTEEYFNFIPEGAITGVDIATWQPDVEASDAVPVFDAATTNTNPQDTTILAIDPLNHMVSVGIAIPNSNAGTSPANSFDLFIAAEPVGIDNGNELIAPASNVGDPHLLTFDGLFYDFQDTGEFTLIQSTDANSFTVQARMREWDLGDAVGDKFSVNTAIATQMGAFEVGFYIPGSLPFDPADYGLDASEFTNEIPALYIDGQAHIIPDNGVILVDSGYIHRQGDTYTVINGFGDRFTVTIHDKYIDFVSYASSQRSAGTVEGLLGNYDGDTTNEYKLDDGTDLGSSISVATLYDVFGEDWRITQGESLFLYGEGETTSSFDNPDFENTQRGLDDFDPALVAAAESAAIAEGFDATSAVFDAVVLDFLVMGYVEYTETWQILEQQSANVVDAVLTEYDGNVIEGTVAAEAITGTAEEDYILAYAGNDTIYGRADDDTIVGGEGNDTIYGEAGIDTYIHNVGDGNDHIYSGEYLSLDSLVMNGVANDDLFIRPVGYDLQVTNVVSGETVILDNQYYSTGKSFATVNGIDVRAGLEINATDAADVFYGTAYDDTITAGLGNDTVYGSYGVDIYIHNEGDGNDHIHSGEYNSSDTIIMNNASGNLIAEEDLQFTVSVWDLIVKDRNTGESIVLDNQYYSTGKTIASVNGIDVTGAMSFVGTDASEVMYGTVNADTFVGGLGNDTIYGQTGIDVYIHNEGDGNDHVYSGEVNSSDTIIMNDASGNLIAEEDLQFTVSVWDLIVKNRSTGESIVLDNQYYSTGKAIASVNGIDVTGAMNFVGTDATEVIYATVNDDTIEGGLGNDTIYGQTGVDVYIHNEGDGNDYLYSGEFNSSDTVIMKDASGNLIAEEDFLFTVLGYDLKITHRDSGEFVILDNQYYSTGKSFASINGIDLTSGLNIVASDNAETFYGTNFDDTLEGGEGDDIIYGQGGDDLYIHHRGDGNDQLLSGEYNSLDSVLMYDDNNTLIAEDDLQFIVNGYDLIVKDRISGESVTLDNLYYSTGNTFATVNGIDMSGGVNSIGTASNETLSGTAHADTLVGAGGVDYLYGNGGADLFIHREGDGSDYLFSGEVNSSDVISMRDANDVEIAAVDITFSQMGWDLVVTNTNTNEILILDNMYYSTGHTFDSLNGIDLDTVI